MKTLLRIAGMVTILSLLLPLGYQSAANAQTLVHLKVATQPVDFTANVLFAQDMGFFKREGLDVEISTLANGATVLPAVAAGSFDCGAGSLPAIAAAHERGLPILITAPGGEFSTKAPTEGIVVAKTSTIRSAKDLIGKTIAMPSLRGGLATVGLSAWFERNKLDPNSVKLVELPGSAVGPALAVGRIDAAELLEPELSYALSQNARILAHMLDAIAPTFLVGAYFCSADFVRDHPELVAKFNAAISAASVWANHNQAQSATILERYSRVTITPTMVRCLFPDKLRVSDVQVVLDASAKYGFLKTTFNAADMFVPATLLH